MRRAAVRGATEVLVNAVPPPYNLVNNELLID
jgi:hypothetical protein